VQHAFRNGKAGAGAACREFGDSAPSLQDSAAFLATHLLGSTASVYILAKVSSETFSRLSVRREIRTKLTASCPQCGLSCRVVFVPKVETSQISAAVKFGKERRRYELYFKVLLAPAGHPLLPRTTCFTGMLVMTSQSPSIHQFAPFNKTVSNWTELHEVSFDAEESNKLPP
jgi:hypothetical protein